jgi:glucose/arabinose dehydrogenase
MKMHGVQAGLLALAACGTSATTGNQASAAQPRGGLPFAVTPVATFDSPWAMAFLPNRPWALVTEKPGRIWQIDLTNGRKTPVSGVPPVAARGQGGLLDVAISPTYATDGLVYLTYSEPSPNGGSGLALARAQLIHTETGISFNGLGVLWHDPAGGDGGQFGAIILFSRDGKSLFLSTGDRQRFTPAQDPSQPLGKILHLTLDGKPAPGNPMAGRTGAPVVTVTDPPRDTEAAKHTEGRQIRWPGPNLTPSETWTTGHRNPYGLTFDAQGHLWSTEMGPRGGDELNLILPGRNYGWPAVSEGENYDGVPIAKPSTAPQFEPAKLWWVPSISPTSLLIYLSAVEGKWLHRDLDRQGPDPGDVQRRPCAKGRGMGDAARPHPLGRRGPRRRYLSARGR